MALSSDQQALVRLARIFAKRNGIDPDMFVRQINLESGFRTNAVSPAGAQGIAQFMPGTAKSRGVNPLDPRSALSGAAKLDADLIKQTGSVRNALAAYNAGPGNIRAGLGYADRILQGKSGGISSAASGGTPATTTTPGVDRSGDRRAVLLNWLLNQSKGPQAGANLTGAVQQIHALGDTPPRTVSTSTGASASPSSVGADTGAKGTASFEGKKVAAWIAPWLQKARQAGWQGTVTSGYRSFADQTRIYNSGVRPAAKPGTSNHEGTDFPRGAVDVTNAAQLSSILRRLGSPLVWAGSKDPPHFSRPHGGSY
jgi:Transglycosylase SLT domain